MVTTFDHNEVVAEDIETFWFKPEGRFSYLPGQITEVFVPHANPDNRGERRWFTLSSTPAEPLLGITMKFPQPSSTYKQALRALKPGDQVHFSDPIGDFVLPKNPDIPLLFVAGGIGVAGIRSLVKQLHDDNKQRNVRILYGARSQNELAYLDLFDTYGAPYTTFVTQPAQGWNGKVGRITSTDILAELQHFPDALVYLTGPEPMIVQLITELKRAGIPDYQLVIDYYPGYTQL